jgi:hypothetical protein
MQRSGRPPDLAVHSPSPGLGIPETSDAKPPCPEKGSSSHGNAAGLHEISFDAIGGSIGLIPAFPMTAKKHKYIQRDGNLRQRKAQIISRISQFISRSFHNAFAD